MKKTQETATFAGGCFWCTEAIFQRVKGVTSVTSGYSGGEKKVTYEEVSSGATGHAEAIQITYNPQIISFEKLLLIFFKTHDPTTLNRQGADIGTQYRSVIFYHSDKQKKQAEDVIKQLNDKKVFNSPIVTEIVPYIHFFVAEDYHQNYYNNNKNAGYCKIVINPKLEKFTSEFTDLIA